MCIYFSFKILHIETELFQFKNFNFKIYLSLKLYQRKLLIYYIKPLKTCLFFASVVQLLTFEVLLAIIT